LYYCIFSAHVLVHMISANFFLFASLLVTQENPGSEVLDRSSDYPPKYTASRPNRPKPTTMKKVWQEEVSSRSLSPFLNVSDSDYYRPYTDCTRCRHGEDMWLAFACQCQCLRGSEMSATEPKAPKRLRKKKWVAISECSAVYVVSSLCRTLSWMS
jgi:hypothetical protein